MRIFFTLFFAFTLFNYSLGSVDMGAVLLVNPTSPMCPNSAQTIVVRVQNYNATMINFAIDNVTISVNISGASTQTFSATLSVGTLSQGAIQNVTITGICNLSSSGTHSIIANTNVAGDINTTNDAIVPVNIQVLSVPTLSSSLAPPAICSGSTFSYNPTSSTAGASYKWKRAFTAGITNPADSGSANPNETLINSTSSAISATYDYTISANGCTNFSTFSVIVSVIPMQNLNSVLSPASICSADTFKYQATSAIFIATFVWTRLTTIGIAETGTTGVGNVNEVLTNTSSAPIQVSYNYITTANGCANTPGQNVIVIVNPIVNGFIHSSLACDSVPTAYPFDPVLAATPPQDQIYIFCTPDSTGIAVLGSLTSSFGSNPNYHFVWSTYDTLSNSYSQYHIDSSSANSTISGLSSGGYHLEIKDTSGNTVACDLAWVFINQTIATVSPVLPTCLPFNLHGTADAVRNFKYYSPPAEPFIVDSKTLIKVTITATHTFVSDLGFYFIAPNGATVGLAPNPEAINLANGCCCNGGDNINNLCFSTQNSTAFLMCTMAAPLTGVFQSWGSWSNIYGNPATLGGWSVQTYDCIGADVGALTHVTIEFSRNACNCPSRVFYDSHAINSVINDNSCTAQTASIYTVPLAQNLPVILNNTISFQWTANPSINIPNATTSLTPTINSPPLVDTWFYLTVTDNFGCVKKDSTLFVAPSLPVAQFATQNICDRSIVPFTDLSTLSDINAQHVLQVWSWAFGDGSPVNNNQNTTHVYGAIGSYTVSLIVTSNYGCKDSVSRVVIVNPKPVVIFTGQDTVGCQPLCVDFQNLTQNNINSTLIWDFGDGEVSGNTQSIMHCYRDSSSSILIYNVALTVTSDSGCISKLIKNNYITVYPDPVAAFSVDPNLTSITKPDISFTDLSTGTNFWNWNFGDAATSVLQSPLTHSYADTGTYEITLITTNQYNCSDTFRQTITIEPEFIFYIPNSFSPNGDGLNDFFSAKGLFISEFEIKIFDRWGNLIFMSKDINYPWDGKANNGNAIAQQDVYVYTIKIKDFRNKEHSYKGIVTLVK